MEFASYGAVVALILSILLIMRGIKPFYALVLSSLVGGYISSFDLVRTLLGMWSGVVDIFPAILRVLAAGVLAGSLIKSNSATKIATYIIEKLGQKHALFSLIIATFVLTASGVFIDVAVMTVAPIALVVNRKSGISSLAILFALVGGGKSGNMVSPNPNTIAAASNYGATLSEVMFANLGSAIVGIFVTLLILRIVKFKGEERLLEKDFEVENDLPNILAAISGPILAIFLLILKPLFGISIDTIIALPIGGLMTAIATKKASKFISFSRYGVGKMVNVGILLAGTGCLGGIIKASTLKGNILGMMSSLNLGDFLIAPISGAAMGFVTASTTAGAAIASDTFSGVVIPAGIPAVWGAAMTNAGATILDHTPHGSFYHVTAGSIGMKFSDRMKIVPLESIVGIFISSSSVLSYLIFRWISG